MSSLINFRKNLYSQDGEDGVIEEIFKRLSINKGTFVEFGAWDGKYLSNTFALLEKNWAGVYIEGDKSRFQDLIVNMESMKDNVELINLYVKTHGKNSLDNILSRTKIGKDFDLLSIDIDTYDWHIWESLKIFRPKVVVIEINSSIPIGIYQTHHGQEIKGSSFSSTISLGKQKGYTPICHTGNLILIRNEFLDQINLPENEILFPELLFDYKWVSALKKSSNQLNNFPKISLFRRIIRKIKSI